MTNAPDWLAQRIERLTFTVSIFHYGPKSELRRLSDEDAVRDIRAGMERECVERERQARLDEHKILAGLDEEGRKRRYFELKGKE